MAKDNMYKEFEVKKHWQYSAKSKNVYINQK
jgi:hypothetical protein